MKLQRSKLFPTLLCLLLNAGWALSEQIDTKWLRFSISPSDGRCELLDKEANVTWSSATNHFGWLTAKVGGKSARFELAGCEVSKLRDGLLARFKPFPHEPRGELRVRIQSLPDRRGLELDYEVPERAEIQEISLADGLISVTDTGSGYVLVPAREGLLIPANSGLAFDHRFDTYAYEGCHMRMLGAVQHGAAALVNWADPYVAAHLKSLTNSTGQPAGQIIETSFVMRKSARSLRIHVLGKGDHVAVANAYRELAREQGWFVPWKEKLRAPRPCEAFRRSQFRCGARWIAA
jgi:hypothetical protein